MKIAIINGPNLNLLGKRETDIYGQEDFEHYLHRLRKKHPDLGITYYQSNVEGDLVSEIQKLESQVDGIILNAGAYTHTSIALADAIAAIKTPVVEVHISNIFAREPFRHTSYTGAKCLGSISGFGLHGYEMAVNYFIENITR